MLQIDLFTFYSEMIIQSEKMTMSKQKIDNYLQGVMHNIGKTQQELFHRTNKQDTSWKEKQPFLLIKLEGEETIWAPSDELSILSPSLFYRT